MPTILEKIERSLSESSHLQNGEQEHLLVDESEEELVLAHADFAASVKENREMTEVPHWLDALQIIALYAVYAFSALFAFIFALMLFNCWRRKKQYVIPSV